MLLGLVAGLALLGPPAIASIESIALPTVERAVTDIVPAPVEAKAAAEPFLLTPGTVICADKESLEVAQYLQALLKPATGYPLPVHSSAEERGGKAIELFLIKDGKLGAEGYRLEVHPEGVRIRATTTDGLFSGVQSLRQLFPAAIESKTVQTREWPVAGGTVVDFPRFGHRSAMLDVARHFFTPDQVKLYIDQIAQYKINTLHLHLTDDQGWRIEIKSWPKLATIGGQTAVGGDPGGYYTQEQYRDIVAYAASRHIDIVPEVDMPGHTNAAQHSYAELNCDGVAVPPRTDIEVGYSSLCIGLPITYTFVEDVIRELSALTPGRYLHIGGDEAHSTKPEDYQAFQDKVQPLAAKYGKEFIGWHEIAKATPPVTAVPQFWGTNPTAPEVTAAAQRGNKILMSPANRAYLDMKYNKDTPIGLSWAGLVEVQDSYGWDPSTAVTGVAENQIAGVEAPLWSETIRTSDNIEYLAFPRLPGIAEIGWSPRASHDWTAYRDRLAKQGPRLTAQGIDFYRSPQVDWK
ncbi:beta-N-acetylhexosaminidase [Pseudonocardiaceae bacterium YIM PH 21723]|nr:beta-N-acetylhexosaminidase [Pseudonocardiaceae bacterium YIM PH 21723]